MLDGQKIIDDSTSGGITPGSTLLRFIGAAIDVERAERLALIGDAATISPSGVSMRPSEAAGMSPALDTIRSLNVWQIGGLVVAAGLAIALATGQFR